MRKVIQIAISGHANTIQTQCDVTTIALCNDGTMWGMFGFGNEWKEIKLPPACVVSDERPIPKPILKSSGLSVRARKAIFRGGFTLMRDLTAEALRNMKNCGEVTIKEILEWKSNQ